MNKVLVVNNPLDVTNLTKLIIIFEQTFIIDIDKIDIITNTKNRRISKWLYDANNNLLYTHDNHNNKIYLLELLTDTNREYNTYSFIDNNPNNITLKNIKVTNKFIDNVENEFVKSLGYKIVKLLHYINDGKTKNKDNNIKNIIWEVKTQSGNNIALLYVESNNKLVEFSLNCVPNVLKAYEQFKTIWFYSPRNEHIMSKSIIGGLYFHLLIIGDTTLNHKKVTHIDNNKLNNNLENLKYDPETIIYNDILPNKKINIKNENTSDTVEKLC